MVEKVVHRIIHHIGERSSCKDGLCWADSSNADHKTVDERANNDCKGGREGEALRIGWGEMVNAVSKKVNPIRPALVAIHVKEEAMQTILDESPDQHAERKEHYREGERTTVLEG